jgi:hypothetical protein
MLAPILWASVRRKLWRQGGALERNLRRAAWACFCHPLPGCWTGARLFCWGNFGNKDRDLVVLVHRALGFGALHGVF